MSSPNSPLPLRLLVVEDSEDDAKLALRGLRRAGLAVEHERVESAAGLHAALARGGWDAVIADYKMPGFTGLQALEMVKAAGLDIPFILVSGTIGEELAVAAMKAGASDYVIKKSLERLAPALERELEEASSRAARRAAEKAMREQLDELRRFQQATVDRELRMAELEEEIARLKRAKAL